MHSTDTDRPAARAGAERGLFRRWLPGTTVRVRFGDVFVCAPDWSWHSGMLRGPDLWYVTDGVGWIREGGDTGERHVVTEGDLVLLQGQRSYHAGHDPQRPLSLIAVHFELRDAAGRAVGVGPAGAAGPFVLHADAGGFVHDLLVRTVRSLQDGCVGWAEAWFQSVIMEIGRQLASSWPAGRLGDQARRIAQMCERIRRRPGEPVRIDDLAAAMGMSPEHFSRLFRRLQGVPPRAFITRTRMDAARRLLLTSSHSIERIAALLGYDSPFQFSRQFKARTGTAPSHYRNRVRHFGEDASLRRIQRAP